MLNVFNWVSPLFLSLLLWARNNYNAFTKDYMHQFGNTEKAICAIVFKLKNERTLHSIPDKCSWSSSTEKYTIVNFSITC